METKIKKIQKLLNNYFCKNTSDSWKLPILDNNDTRKDINGYSIPFYTGVTLTYIMKYIIKYKYKKDLVIYSLLDMLDNEEIKSLYCPTLGKIVYENNGTDHWTYKVIRTPERRSEESIKNTWAKGFNIYCAIKEELNKK